jgi:prolyl-tRNA synthetase
MVKGEYSSYKDLPLMIYQVQTKYRDEARPRAGVLRGREFVMKDSYSFDLDDEGLQRSYDLHREAYARIFERLGMDYRIVSAVSGAMGGSASEEFLAPAPTGEDTFVLCTSCDYAANTEAVQLRAAEPGDPPRSPRCRCWTPPTRRPSTRWSPCWPSRATTCRPPGRSRTSSSCSATPTARWSRWSWACPATARST